MKNKIIESVEAQAATAMETARVLRENGDFGDLTAACQAETVYVAASNAVERIAAEVAELRGRWLGSLCRLHYEAARGIVDEITVRVTNISDADVWTLHQPAQPHLHVAGRVPMGLGRAWLVLGNEVLEFAQIDSPNEREMP